MASAETATPDWSNKKVEAVKSIYKLLKNENFWCLSFEDLQNIFLKRSTLEFITLFEALLFQEPTDSLSKDELISSLKAYTATLDITWPTTKLKTTTRQHSLLKLRSLYSTTISKSIQSRHEESLQAIADQVGSYVESQDGATTYKSSEVVRHFSAQLLQSLHKHITDNGYEKAKVMGRLKSLIKHYEEEWAWWVDVQKRCARFLGKKQSMTVEEFKKVFPLEEFMATRIFALADRNGDGEVDRRELLSVTSTLVMGDSSQKLKFLFSIYDQNGDGHLDKSELRHALSRGIRHSNLDVGTDSAALLIDHLFAKAKENVQSEEGGNVSTETMTYDELNRLLSQNPMLYDNLNISLTKPTEADKKQTLSFGEKVGRVRNHMQMYTSLWVWVSLMSAVTIALGAERLYRRLEMIKENGCCVEVAIAKVCGQMLNFLLSLLILFVLKDWITKLQKTWVRHYLPFDDAIWLHKITTGFSFFISVVHVVAHVANIVNRVSESGESLHTYFSDGSVNLLVFYSGVVLLLLLILFIITANGRMRAKSYWVFYISHKVFFFLWYAALICHASKFIYWFLLPGVLLLFERLHAVYNMIRNRSVVEFASTHANATMLSIRKPSQFTYNPGDYLIVNIPQVSPHLWRPFTISSGKQDDLTFHIRKVGLWTGKVHDMVSQLERAGGGEEYVNAAFRSRFMVDIDENGSSGDSGSSAVNEDMDIEKFSSDLSDHKSERPMVSPNWKIYLDGPFSTPSHDILNTEHAILVAGGIGITPFASVLSNIIEQLRDSSKVCPCGCETRVYFDNITDRRLKRIDLFWLTRTHKSLHWFVDVFEELEKEQISLGLDPPLVNVHLHLTGLAKQTDMRGTFLQLALSTSFDKEATDLLTGLKAQTKPGRPDWESVIPKLVEDAEPLKTSNGSTEKKSKSKVYVCGPTTLCKDLKRICSKLKLLYSEEVFN